MFGFIAQEGYKFASDGLGIDEMDTLTSGDSGYTCNSDYSGSSMAYFTTPQITASGSGSSSYPTVIYLENVTLSPTTGDTTGTSFTVSNLPTLTAKEKTDGYEYVYILKSTATSPEVINRDYISGVKIKNSPTFRPNQCNKIPANGKITVSEESVVLVAKINPKYKDINDEYYTFAAAAFPAKPTPPVPETDAEKAAKAIGTALNGLDPANDTKESDVQAIINENKGDTTADITDFELIPATKDEEGSLKVTVTVTDDDGNTETVEKTYIIDKLPASADEGDVIVDTKDNVGGAGVDGTEIRNAVDVTPEEKRLIDSGEDLYIILNVLNADNTVSAEDKELTKSVLSDGMKAGMYLDITLFKKIGTLQTAVTETNSPITITFAMPADRINTDKNVTREFFVIRVHNGKAEIISCTFDPATGEASFKTDRFSSYAIAYKDKTSGSTPVKPAPVYPIPGYPTLIYPSFTHYIPTASVTASFKEKLNVTAEAQEKTVKLSWNKIKNADGYVVYQLKDGKYVKVTTTKDTSVTFDNKTNGVTYKYMVKYTVNGRTCPTSCSGKASAMVYYKPIVTADADKNSVSLSWKAVPDADKYAIYKYADGKAVKLAEVSGRAVLVKGLRSGTEYSYIVSAYVDGKWTTMLRSDIVTVNTEA